MASQIKCPHGVDMNPNPTDGGCPCCGWTHLQGLHEQDPCSSKMLIPRSWTFEDRGVALHFEHHVREQLPWYELATGALAHYVRHYLPRQGLVYDVGASTGNVGRALLPTLRDRGAVLVAIEPALEMRQQYRVPGLPHVETAELPERTCPLGHYLLPQPAEDVAFGEADVVVFFLSIMFVPVPAREQLLKAAHAALRRGGVMLCLDKEEQRGGYASLATRRLTLAGKRASGVSPEEIIDKELSLSGVQRAVEPEMFPEMFGSQARQWFRFGEFVGWLVER